MPIANTRPSLFAAIPAVLAATLVAVACGGSTDSTVDGGNGNGSDNGSGVGAQPNLSPGGPSGNGGPGSVTTISPDAACATGTGTADAIPAVVEMVVDISGSMLER